jgi:hypothetical protein
MELMSTKKLSKNTKQQKLFVTIENSTLTKEVEFQELEIQLAEKQMK